MPTNLTSAERQVLNEIYAERFARCMDAQNAEAPQGCAQLAADQTEAAITEYRRRFGKRTFIGAFLAMFLAGCSLTPTQQKWAGIGASVVITGVLIAHRTDDGMSMARPERSINPPSCASGGCK